MSLSQHFLCQTVNSEDRNCLMSVIFCLLRRCLTNSSLWDKYLSIKAALLLVPLPSHWLSKITLKSDQITHVALAHFHIWYMLYFQLVASYKQNRLYKANLWILVMEGSSRKWFPHELGREDALSGHSIWQRRINRNKRYCRWSEVMVQGEDGAESRIDFSIMQTTLLSV